MKNLLNNKSIEWIKDVVIFLTPIVMFAILVALTK